MTRSIFLGALCVVLGFSAAIALRNSPQFVASYATSFQPMEPPTSRLAGINVP